MKNYKYEGGGGGLQDSTLVPHMHLVHRFPFVKVCLDLDYSQTEWTLHLAVTSTWHLGMMIFD